LGDGEAKMSETEKKISKLAKASRNFGICAFFLYFSMAGFVMEYLGHSTEYTFFRPLG